MGIAVIADDITGALDTGVQFSKWSLDVKVFTDIRNLETSNFPGVVVIDTESRYDMPKIAYKKVYSAAESLNSLGFDVIYKKIDSTCRGNIGTEIDAVMDATDQEVVYLSPAYPLNGRIVKNGKLFINGTPLSKTEYSDELLANTSDIAVLIGVQSTRKIGKIDLETIRCGEIDSQINSLIEEDNEIIVFDAITESDLHKIAKTARVCSFLSGSAGLAAHLPMGLSLVSPKPVLTVNGSQREISRIQSELLVKQLGCHKVELNTMKLLDSMESFNAIVDRSYRKVLSYLESNGDVVVISAPNEDSVERTLDYGMALGFETKYVRDRIDRALGDVIAKVLSEVEISGLIIVGGATALSIFGRSGISRLGILNEVQPGIPIIDLGQGLRGITKAGGFGDEGTLVRALLHLKQVGSG